MCILSQAELKARVKSIMVTPNPTRVNGKSASVTPKGVFPSNAGDSATDTKANSITQMYPCVFIATLTAYTAMLLERVRLGIHAITVLIGVGLVPCVLAGAEPITPTPKPPAPSPTVFDLPLVAYPPVTPWTSFSARSITEDPAPENRDGLAPAADAESRGSRSIFTKAQSRASNLSRSFTRSTILFRRLHARISTSTTSRVVIYPTPTDRTIPQFVLQFAPPNKPNPPMRWFRTPEEIRSRLPSARQAAQRTCALPSIPATSADAWAQMEERSTRYQAAARRCRRATLISSPARILKQELTNMGASVLRRARLDRSCDSRTVPTT